MLKVIDAIKKIYPEINGGFVYWETRQDGLAWENPIDGLVWENQQFEKPTWQQIQDNLGSVVKEDLILEIKQEAGKRIEAVYPDYKQRNLNGAVSRIQNKEILALKAGENYSITADELLSLRAAKDCENFILAIRAKSNQLEDSLDIKTLAELEAFDPSDNLNWS